MSRLATLPNALRIELVERRRDDTNGDSEVVQALEGGAYVNVSSPQAIYAVGCAAVVEVNNNRFYRFTMPDETAACAAVEQLARIAK